MKDKYIVSYRARLIFEIKNKFHFISRFCALAKLDLYETNKILNYGHMPELRKIKGLADSIEDEPIKGKELPDNLKDAIVNEILTKYRTRSAFCIKKKYDNAYISHVTGAKRVRITSKLKKLCSTLGINL